MGYGAIESCAAGGNWKFDVGDQWPRQRISTKERYSKHVSTSVLSTGVLALSTPWKSSSVGSVVPPRIRMKVLWRQRWLEGLEKLVVV